MTMTVRGVRVPAYLYGTAWKEDATEQCVIDALDAGFRGIDTANQRKHYFEEGVGRALDAKFREGFIARRDLFLQTKFTFRDGQDDRLPYDERAPIADQVQQSFASSLTHLGVEQIDSLVLHGPSQRDGLGKADHEAWRAMEAIASSGRVKLLGISNATARQVEELIAFAAIQPAFVQNRTYAERSWDSRVRELCSSNDIVYQGFSLLTANRQVLANAKVAAIAVRYSVTPAQVVFRFAQQLGMLPLTGTRDPVHMREDLAIHGFTLDTDELAVVNAAGR
ncbi:MAG TPA: aldo/keto reductase [Kofleriaceae bacterium]|jgi:diketogulonate reductase-like aldo/keto reductase